LLYRGNTVYQSLHRGELVMAEEHLSPGTLSRRYQVQIFCGTL
jgi:hypothetical protein